MQVNYSPQNTDTQIKPHYSITIDDSLKLVPYQKQHVLMYNKWMSNQTLCHLTGSEHLTLQQQYICQGNWTIDHTRDTFLILYNNVPVGDVNIFFSPWLEDDEGEINIMIAEELFRGKGIASKVIKLMEEYASASKNRTVMIARIKDGNTSSIALFKKLGYDQIKFNEKEKQYEFRKKLQKMQWKEFLQKYNVKQQVCN